jgi:uncharacterized protein
VNRKRTLALAIGTVAGVMVVLNHAVPRWLGGSEAADTRYVEDRVQLLSEAQRGRIAQYHAALRREHDIDYRVLAVSEGGDLDMAAHRYFGETGVGSLSARGRGLLLVIDTALQRVRLEVSTTLEGVYTDAFVAYVQHRQMVPFFQAGRVADGILATTELIVGRAQDAVAGKEFSPTGTARSMGGGAAADAVIGSVEDPAAAFKQRTETITAEGLAPLQVVEAYLNAMSARDARPDLPIYTADTVLMLRDWVVTPAQMDNVVRTYEKCTVDGVRVQNDRAVARYRVDQRRCAPYFLRLEEGAWRLDLAAASAFIRFNHNNQWRFPGGVPEGYAFAFADWEFDRNGFPRAATARN